MKNNIALIGMPAVGKSTVGVVLAKNLGFDFLDTDILIQSRENKTLADIIEAKGLDGFLDIEGRHVASVDCSHHVIATGGSVVYREAAMAHLAKISRIVYLSIELDTLMTRLSDITSRGVAIGPGKGMEDLYKERTPLYDRYCDIKIDCGDLGPDRVMAAVLKQLS